MPIPTEPMPVTLNTYPLSGTPKEFAVPTCIGVNGFVVPIPIEVPLIIPEDTLLI